jgi:hypothetical protein
VRPQGLVDSLNVMTFFRDKHLAVLTESYRGSAKSLIVASLGLNFQKKERCYSLNRQLKALRWQTLQNFLIPKLLIKWTEQLKLVLHIMKGMFHS